MAAQSGDPASLAGESGDPDESYLLNVLPHRMRYDVKYRKPHVSVFLLSRNEGDQVIPTIENMWACGADDVTVIDDGSTDGSCDPRKLPGDVQIVRHNEGSGCGYGRFDGMGCSDGDVCVTADAHVHGPEGCFQEMANVALERRAIVCPAITSTKRPGEWTAYGAALEFDVRKGYFEHYCFGDKPKETIAPISCLYGGIYVFPKYVVKRMGRVSRMTRWGYNEMTHSIRALLCDVPLFVDTRFVFEHRYKLKRENDDTNLRIMNFFRAGFIFLDKETYEQAVRPALVAKFGSQMNFDPRQDIEEDPFVLDERKVFRTHKIWSDEDLLMYVVRNQLAAQSRPRITVDVTKEGF